MWLVDSTSCDGTAEMPSADALSRREDLLEYKVKVDTYIASLKGDLVEAKQRYQRGGAGTPRDVRNASWRVLSWYKALSQQLQLAAAICRRERVARNLELQEDQVAQARDGSLASRAMLEAARLEKDKRDERRFVEAARRLLTGAQYAAIWAEARGGSGAQ